MSMALTNDDKIQSSPRASKDPKSYEYARQMVYVLRTIWTKHTFNMRDWEKEVEEAKQNKIWERLGYGSIDEVLKEEVGYSKQELSLKIASAKATKEKQQGKRPTSINLIEVKPNSNGAVLRRLARDCPEMLDRIEAGELSVNQAAIAAGIRKKPSHAETCVRAFRKAENRMAALDLIVGELTAEELEWIRRHPAAHEKSPTRIY